MTPFRRKIQMCDFFALRMNTYGFTHFRFAWSGAQIARNWQKNILELKPSRKDKACHSWKEKGTSRYAVRIRLKPYKWVSHTLKTFFAGTLKGRFESF